MPTPVSEQVRTRTPHSPRAAVEGRDAKVANGSAPVFDTGAARRSERAYRRQVRGWLPMDRTAPILVAGCGSGRMLYTLKKMGFTHLHGVDGNEQRLVLARQVLARVVAGDLLTYLDEHAGRFRLIVGLDLVEHLAPDEIPVFLERAHRALVPGGRVILRMPNGEGLRAVASHRPEKEPAFAFAPPALEQLVRERGFANTECRETHPPVNGVAGFVSAALWQGLRCCALGRDLVAAGRRRSRVFTSNFLMSACAVDATGAAVGGPSPKRSALPAA